MPENFLIKYIYIIAIFIIGTVAAIGPFILVYLVAPRTREKKQPPPMNAEPIFLGLPGFVSESPIIFML